MKNKLGRKRRTWTDEEINLLGTMSDEKLAFKLNIKSSSTVFYQRRRLNIKSFGEQKDVHRNWTDEEINLLGTMYDHDLANKIGISRLNVYKKRTQLNIKSYKKTK